MLLLRASAGDVEINPGPLTNKKIDRLYNALEDLMEGSLKNQEENVTKLYQLENSIAALGTRTASFENQVQEIGIVKENMNTVHTALSSVQHKPSALRFQIVALGNTMDDIEHRMRSDNVRQSGDAAGCAETGSK